MEGIHRRYTSGSKGPGISPRVSKTDQTLPRQQTHSNGNRYCGLHMYNDKMAANSSTAWADLWTGLSGDQLTGWVTSLSQAERICQMFEIENSLKYICKRRPADFGHIVARKPKENARVRFYDIGDKLVPYDGVPFIIQGNCEKQCMFGSDQHRARKAREQEMRVAEQMNDHPTCSYKRRKRLLQTSKKRGCTARIVMKHVVRYPDFKVQGETRRQRRLMSEMLRSSLAGDNHQSVREEHRIYICLPNENHHKDVHHLGQLTGLLNPLSKEVKEKLVQLVGEGVSSLPEMRRHLKVYVQSTFAHGILPSATDAAYFPQDSTIRKHIYMAQLKLRYSKLDQENLTQQVNAWQQQNPDDNFHFRPAVVLPSSTDIDEIVNGAVLDKEDDVIPHSNTALSSSLFFCHQSKYQRHLLRRYGNTLCLLDATYRTTKYALPLFFLAVKTNVGFSVVAEFVVETETREAIKEGLATIKKWQEEDPENPANWEWNPKFFMTDFSEMEISAIEETFPDCKSYLCDFHREQSWTRWVRKIENGVSGIKDDVLKMLRRCAHSNSVDEFNAALKALQNSMVWVTNPKLRNWFGKKWIPEAERWVWAFRHGQGLQVNTNNGLERQNKIFKYTFLEKRNNNSLSSMLESLLTGYLPSMMLRYIKENASCSEGLGRRYNQAIPEYLHNRPSHFVKHCMDKIELAEAIPEHDIVRDASNTFKVRSQSRDDRHDFTVMLQTDSGLPSCGCHSWTWSHLPCKHMFAVLDKYPDISWQSLPEEYRSSPLFILDDNVGSFMTPQSHNEERSDMNQQSPDGKDNVQRCHPMASNLPSRKRALSSLKAAAVTCREKLTSLSQMSYLCQDVDTLHHTEGMIDDATSYMRLHMYDDDVVNCFPPKGKKKREKLSPENNSKSHLKTVKGKSKLKARRRQHMTRRVGTAAERARKKVSLSPDKPKVIQTNVIEEGHTEVPLCDHLQQHSNKQMVLSKATELVKSLSQEEWKQLVERAQCTKTWLSDKISQTAMSIFDKFVDNDQMDLLNSLFALSPDHLGRSTRLRIVNILVSDLVERGLIQPVIDVNGPTQKMADETMPGMPQETGQQSNRVTFSDRTCHGKESEDSSQSALKEKLLADIQSSQESKTLKLIRGTRFHICGEVLDAADFVTLDDNNWLTDKVVNAYLALLKSQSNKHHEGHIYVLPSYLAVLWEQGRFETFLYQKVKMSLYDWIFMPMNVNNNHWVLIAANVRTRKVSFLDSMSSKGGHIYLARWRKFMKIRAKKVGELEKWTVDNSLKSTKQTDGHSCGLYVLLNALALTRGINELHHFRTSVAIAMREYTKQQLISAAVQPPSQRKTCDMLECVPTDPGQMWVCCDVCGRWLHFICVNLNQTPKADYICPICMAQYE